MSESYLEIKYKDFKISFDKISKHPGVHTTIKSGCDKHIENCLKKILKNISGFSYYF